MSKRKKRRSAPTNCFWNEGVLWGRKKINGVDHKWSLRTDDAKVAEKRVKDDIARLIARVMYGESWTGWEDAVAGWAENYAPDRKIGENSLKRYAVSLRQLEPWLLGRVVDGKADAQMNGIDAAVVSTIVAARRQAEVSASTIRRDLGAMASVLTYCQQEQLRSDNPALDRLRLIKERRDPIVLPNPAHVQALIQRAPGLMAGLIEAAWRTGCRQNELVTARRSNLDHDRRELTVIGKGNKLRVIELDPFGGYDTLRTLPPHLRSPWLFWHDDGEPYRNVSARVALLIRGLFEKAYDTAHGTTAKTRPPTDELLAAQDEAGWVDVGFRPFTFHDLRHLHAVEWLRSGRSIYDLQYRLGHASITTTEMYLKYLTPEQVRIAKRAGDQKGEHLSRGQSAKGGLSA